MKLYTVPGSPSSRKALAVIDHLGLPVEIVSISIDQVRSPTFDAINPNRKVPVLVDGEMHLWELNAIIIYLAESTSDKSLFPPVFATRIDILRWLFWEASGFNAALGAIAFEILARASLGYGEPSAAIIERGQEEFARHAPVLDAHLAERSFIVGESITVADYAMATFEPYRERLPVDFGLYPNIQRHFDRIAAMPAWQRTVGVEPSRKAA